MILLGGAPGAGKGTQTQFISEARGLTCPPIVISELLTTPEMEKIKAQGGMVGDKEVVGVLLRKLLEPIYRDGALLDGFPRTPVQVECLKLLVDKINELHDEFAEHAAGDPFPPADDPRDGAVRQRERPASRGSSGAAARSPNTTGRWPRPASARRSSCGPPTCPRSSVRRRYQVFKEQTWTALTSLRQLYHYHFVNAEGPIAEVQANILQGAASTRARWSWTRAPSSGCGRCRWPRRSSCTPGRSWSSGSTATSWSTRAVQPDRRARQPQVHADHRRGTRCPAART